MEVPVVVVVAEHASHVVTPRLRHCQRPRRGPVVVIPVVVPAAGLYFPVVA